MESLDKLELSHWLYASIYAPASSLSTLTQHSTLTDHQNSLALNLSSSMASSSSSTAASTSMNANAIQNSIILPTFVVPPPASHSIVAPLFSQNNMLVGHQPTSQDTTSLLHLRLDVDGCLRELRRRQLEGTSILGEASTFSPSSNPGPSIPSVSSTLKFVLEKQLTKSDVSRIGRIILPKKPAASKLPILHDKWGTTLIVNDVLSSDKWRMKYRYWPNNNSRMYVLENTGDFIRKYTLTSGDSIAIYQDDNKQNFICAKKLKRPSHPLELAAYEDGRTENNRITIGNNENPKGKEQASSSCNISISNPAIRPNGNPWDLWDEGLDVDEDFTDFSNRSLIQHRRSPSFDDCDFSMFDFKPDEDAGNGSENKKKQ